MVKGIIGQKVGMTQVFDDEGRQVPVTVLKAGPCVVLQVKEPERDGYRAVQLGYLEDGVKARRLSRPERGHVEKAGAPPVKVIREFEMEPVEEDDDGPELGSRVTVEVFEGVEKVDVTGTSKGRGFQGVMHRHGFAGGGAAHGSMFHRRTGSIGASADPSRVSKGTQMPGRMGGERDTQLGLEVVRVEAEDNLLVVKGSVPGARNGYVFIRSSVKG